MTETKPKSSSSSSGSSDEVRPVLSLWLTREEWLACYALQWVAMSTGAYGAESFSEDETEIFFGSLGRGLLWSIRTLDEAGHHFVAVSVQRDSGLVRLNGSEPIEPRNELFLIRLKEGGMPSPILCCEALLELLDKSCITNDGIDREPIRAVLSQAMSDRDRLLKQLAEDREALAYRKEESDLANKVLSEMLPSLRGQN